MTAGVPARRAWSGLVLQIGAVAAALAVLVGLGLWQLDRKDWKEDLIATLTARLSSPPVALPPPEVWPSAAPAEFEYRRVAFSAGFVPGQAALVYTNGSAFRTDVSGPGYWMMAPARLPGGGTVVVNRGFVPEGRQGEVLAATVSAEPSAMTGVLRWPEPRNMFTPNDNPGANIWFVRDQLAIARTKGWGEVAPFFVELESPQPPGGLPRAGPLTIKLRNEHLQYAITWFGLAAALLVIAVLWLGGRGATRRA